MYSYYINYFVTVNINWCKEKQADLMSTVIYAIISQTGMLMATGVAATLLYLF